MTATFLVPVVAAALLVGAEAFTGPRRDPAWLAGVALAAAAVSAVVLLAATVAVNRSVGLTVVGMAAAVAAVALLRAMAHARLSAHPNRRKR